MAVYTFDLRGAIGDRRPEETLAEDWKQTLPRTDRFGVHTHLEYSFIPEPSPQAVLSGDVMVGVVAVPKSEIWEIFSLAQNVVASATGTFSQVRIGVELPEIAQWNITQWRLKGQVPVYARPLRVLTHPKNFADASTFLAYDEASEVQPLSGIRARILYSRSILQARFDVGTDLTISEWYLTLDCVRYPSNERLLEMLDSGEITQRELFAALALRFPSPAEAF